MVNSVCAAEEPGLHYGGGEQFGHHLKMGMEPKSTWNFWKPCGKSEIRITVEFFDVIWSSLLLLAYSNIFLWVQSAVK